jgi:hypothetical protein
MYDGLRQFDDERQHHMWQTEHSRWEVSVQWEKPGECALQSGSST